MAKEDKTPIRKILKAILDEKNISINALANNDKTLQRRLQRQINEGAAVTADTINLFVEKFPDIDVYWMLKGDMRKIKDGHQPRQIPFYDVESTGGYGGLVSSSTDEANLLGYVNAGDWFDKRETAAIRHVGDSMVEYPNGCILAVREVKERHLLVPGRNYVIETSEYRITKRVQRGSSANTIALYSTNSEKYDDGRLVYEPFEIDLSDIRRVFSILGYIVNQGGDSQLIN